jgi:hypothetical protein
MVLKTIKFTVMKKVVLSLLLLSVIATAFGQQSTNGVKDKQYFLGKSQSKKTTAWILLGAGTAAAIGGAIGFSQSFCIFCEDTGASDAYGLLFMGGVVADLASIPFFISAGHYRRLAADVTIGNQDMHLLKQNYFVLNKIPVIIVRVHFR